MCMPALALATEAIAVLAEAGRLPENIDNLRIHGSAGYGYRPFVLADATVSATMPTSDEAR